MVSRQLWVTCRCLLHGQIPVRRVVSQSLAEGTGNCTKRLMSHTHSQVPRGSPLRLG